MLAKIKAEVKSLSREEKELLRNWLDDLLEDELELTGEFKAKIEQGERDLREGRIRVRKGAYTSPGVVYHCEL